MANPTPAPPAETNNGATLITSYGDMQQVPFYTVPIPAPESLASQVLPIGVAVLQ